MSYLLYVYLFLSITVVICLNSRLLYDESLPNPIITHELNQHTYKHYNQRNLDSLPAEITPLYPGYGTHFAYLYVGTPPQRQSVIIDTGSHFTAFPCTGCSQCGQHTDAYYDVTKSNTSIIPKCNNQQCVISQSYSEGSSWRAFKVTDKVYIGGLTPTVIPNAEKYSIDFNFGCQTFETGLFRTQLADGIMGMAIADDTLPNKLYEEKITENKIFALCFRVGGGIMTLGGVDQRLHSKSGILYAKLTKNVGWYTLNLLDVQLQEQSSSLLNSSNSIATDPHVFNNGKGCIVDSGTTDTYLPSSVANRFKESFKSITGIDYTTANIALTSENLAKIPNINFIFEGIDNQPFSISMPWTSYIDSVGSGKYAFRVYLTEGSGTVLGANFMNGYNIIYDVENLKLGFAKSNCKYEDFSQLETRPPSYQATKYPSIIAQNEDIDSDECVSELIPITQCTASCDSTNNQPHVSTGIQIFEDSCGNSSNPLAGSKPCSITCGGDGKLIRGRIDCPELPWSICNKACVYSRKFPLDPKDTTNGTCAYTVQNQVCYSGFCPLEDGDYLVLIDMRIQLDPRTWSYVYTEALYEAFAYMFNIKESSIELLNDVTIEATYGTKLHFQIRVEAKDFNSIEKLNDFAQDIPRQVWEASFSEDLINALNYNSDKYDHLDHSRYGWMLPRDIEVLNAVAMPIGEVRDPVEVPTDDSPYPVNYHQLSLTSEIDLILLGVAIIAISLLGCVLYLHYRLRLEHFKLEKDKNINKNSSLFKVWLSKLSTRLNSKSVGSGPHYTPVQMIETLPDDDEDEFTKL